MARISSSREFERMRLSLSRFSLGGIVVAAALLISVWITPAGAANFGCSWNTSSATWETPGDWS
jgi:hypothetical protein